MFVPEDPNDLTREPSKESESTSRNDSLSSPLSSEETLPSTASPTLASPKAIGPYRLVRKLGEGGMGQVWLAEQTAPLQRLVAIKLIRTGASNTALFARFESERQALARMNHPAIAKVFDAGTTLDGLPYFVMEYVPGIPITLYCDQKRLSIRQRIELFTGVCDGVQHAHQKALIHRDLKPANILVTEIDGKPTPRIIDFGIAKAIAERDSLATMVTREGNFVGTPAYMSPEQADPDVRDIDTRSDVYSLAVILYELLTGSLPFDPTEWRNEVIHEALRRLREQDPPLPSIQFRKLATTESNTAANTAHQRSTEPQQLVTTLRGDLDWITMKALERDRGRRYGTPNELAADLHHFLANEPVNARPASATYRLEKYVRRHRVGVSVGATGLALLIAFAVMQTIQIRRVTQERDRTARERDRANRIADFMTRMFKVSDPSEARGNSITAREVLDKASKDIDTGLAKDPELQAQMMHVMGSVYDNLGLRPRAQSLFERAVSTRSRVLGPKNRDTLASMYRLSWTLSEQGHDADAEKLQRETLEVQRRVLGPEDPDTLMSMNNLAAELYSLGRYAESEKLDRDTLAIRRRVLGPEHKDTLSEMNNLAVTVASEGRYAESEKLLRQAIEAQTRVFGREHPETIRSLSTLAGVLYYQGDFPQSEKLYRELLEIRTRVLGPEHPDTLTSIGNVASVVSAQHRDAEAEKLYRETIEKERRVLGPEHPETLLAMGNLADTLDAEGRHAQAEEMFRQVVETRRRVLGPEHPDTLFSVINLAATLRGMHRLAEAEKLIRETLDIQRRVLAPDHPSTAFSIYNLACVRSAEGQRDQALSLLQEALDHGLAPDIAVQIEGDADLKSLRGDPRFEALVTRAKQLTAPQQKQQ